MKSPEDMTREELEDEVVYLRSELGLMQSDDEVAHLRRAYPMSRAAARLVLALRAAGQRGLTYHQLDEAVPPVKGTAGDRNVKVLTVWVCHARKVMGAAAIETIWGRGVRISPTGAALVDAALNENLQHKRSA